MSIDWITVIAQIANFLVLVWLLKRFLYRPILDGIDAREAEIARRMAEATEAKKEALIAKAKYQEQQTQLLLERDSMVEQALSATESQRDTLLADARQKLEHEQKDWHSYLDEERNRFTAQLQRAGEKTLLELTRKALHDLADQEIEEAIVRHVTARLHPIVDELIQAAGDVTEAIAITRDPLSEKAAAQLSADFERLLPGIALHFDADAQQSPGLILRVRGAQIAWTIDSYTDGFDELLAERLATGTSSRMRQSNE